MKRILALAATTTVVSLAGASALAGPAMAGQHRVSTPVIGTGVSTASCGAQVTKILGGHVLKKGKRKVGTVTLLRSTEPKMVGGKKTYQYCVRATSTKAGYAEVGLSYDSSGKRHAMKVAAGKSAYLSTPVGVATAVNYRGGVKVGATWVRWAS